MSDPNQFDTDQAMGGASAGGDDDREQTLSLMSGVAQPEGLPEAGDTGGDYATMKGGNRLLNHGTMLIILVFVIAGGAIYLMRVGQGEIGSESARDKKVQAEIEEALRRLSRPEAMSKDDPLKQDNIDSLFAGVDDLLETFRTDHTRKQVPVEYVKKDPFIDPAAGQKDDPVEPAHQIVRPKEDPLKKYKQELKDLKVQTIVNGHRPMALVNDEFVRPGDRVGSFTVRSISGMKVELQVDEHIFPLFMEVDEDKRKRSGRR